MRVQETILAPLPILTRGFVTGWHSINRGRSPRLQGVLSALLLATCAILPARLAQANCPGYSRPLETVNREVEQRWNQVKNDSTYFWGKTKMFGSLYASRITLTPAFDRLSGPEKKQVLGTLALDGSTYTVYTADGRLLSAQYDGCTFRTPLLTERDRYSWYLSRPPIATPLNRLQKALRNVGQPNWRVVRHRISLEEEHRARFKFWETVGYDQSNRGWWIAWVPEGGYFEITVGNADGVTQLQSFLAMASPKHRYIVLARDGTPLSDTRYTRGNPWQWLLGKTTAPSGWQVRPCDGDGPFLCVSRQGQRLGTIELQRWDYEKLLNLQQQFSRLGLTPGLITYDNSDDHAKVLAALKTEIANYYRTIANDRAPIYNKTIQFQSRQPKAAQIGRLPGFGYGFEGVGKGGTVREKYVSYMAFDGSKYLYIIATSFDPEAETSTFKDLISLQQFEPHLKTIISNLILPHPDW